MSESGYWLPEDHVLKLTALELGGLIVILHQAREAGFGKAFINRPGPDGEKVRVTMIERLQEKAQGAVQR